MSNGLLLVDKCGFGPRMLATCPQNVERMINNIIDYSDFYESQMAALFDNDGFPVLVDQDDYKADAFAESVNVLLDYLQPFYSNGMGVGPSDHAAALFFGTDADGHISVVRHEYHTDSTSWSTTSYTAGDGDFFDFETIGPYGLMDAYTMTPEEYKDLVMDPAIAGEVGGEATSSGFCAIVTMNFAFRLFWAQRMFLMGVNRTLNELAGVPVYRKGRKGRVLNR